MSALKIYFSFRSPYAWLGCYRFASVAGKLDMEYELIPVSPPRKKLEEITPVGSKMEYIREDASRIARAYGLEYRRPEPFDCDWSVPHAAFLAAAEAGKALDFALGMFNCRFCEGRDISGTDVIESVSKLCGLDPDEIMQSVPDRKHRRRLLEILSRLDEEGIFGVPTFVYGEQRFWGNDRLEWCIREIYRDAGKEVPDLTSDLLARPF
ncbi:MAG: DsbA family protein [Gammaproteobacteria bacterium]|nr:DsbA family protein [Gammaproteobacteria bacterium]